MIFILVINGIHNINGNELNQHLHDEDYNCGLIKNETESKYFVNDFFSYIFDVYLYLTRKCILSI